MIATFVPGRPAREADRALKSASRAEEAARKCAVLWFGEILQRALYRELGYSSMPQYARQELGYSETRIGDFMRLSRKLDQLPAVKAALPEIGYTKAREIVRVAPPKTEARWVDEARTRTRAQLVAKVKRVKGRKRKPARALFVPAGEGPDEPALAAAAPLRVTLEFSPEQFARWEALWARLQAVGATGGRTEIMLEALNEIAATCSEKTGKDDIAPRGVVVPPAQIHVHRCPDCGKTEIGGRTLGRADAARVACDAAISVPGTRNTTTIPPRLRREVLARDRHRCQAPGCRRRRFLEVHHIKPRARGGAHEPANLITLCAPCHRLWHERC